LLFQFCHFNSSSQPSNSSITVRFERGLPILNIPLPSRQEPCQFSLRPLTDNVGGFCEQLQHEDRGLDHVALYTKGMIPLRNKGNLFFWTYGVRIATSTSIEHLLQFGSFRLRLNDKYYDVTISAENLNYDSSSDMERRLIQQLEKAESELRPLHEKKLRIERDCDAHAERVMWAGFAAMGIQTGECADKPVSYFEISHILNQKSLILFSIFARLTWWEYSWDIMEPVTYFATYSTVIATFGYFLYTRQPFEYPSVRERVMTKQFYKRAVKEGFDIERYNSLVTEVCPSYPKLLASVSTFSGVLLIDISKVESVRKQLARIRDPLFQHLPVSYLTKLDDVLSKSSVETTKHSSDSHSFQ
uniref:Calcium uniporter protein n=1 Tax=Angiostrongylus costaricensis TaxID=334426 RepID=A0A0R3Q242_ANGCS